MDDETRAAIDAIWSRIRRLSEMHEIEWKTAAKARDRWGAELDALIAEVELIKASILDLRAQHEQARRHPGQRANPDD